MGMHEVVSCGTQYYIAASFFPPWGEGLFLTQGISLGGEDAQYCTAGETTGHEDAD